MAIDRIPPQALDIEKVVLGSMMISEDSIGVAMSILSDECFYNNANRKIFTGIMELYEKNIAIDILTVANKLKEKQWLEEVGGESFLADTADTMAVTANIEYYAKILRNKAILRKMIGISSDLYMKCFDADADHEVVLEDASNRIFEVAVNHKIVGNVFTAADMVMAVGEEFGRVRSEGRIGVTTGFQELDQVMLGLCRPEVTVIAGRPSMGKTAFALCLMLRQTMVHKIPILFFTIEMSKLSLGQRAVSIESGVGLYGIRSARMSVEHERDMHNGISRLSEAPFYACDKPGITLNEIKSISRMAIKKYGVEVIYIDHTRLMGSKNRDSVERMTEISHGLKNLGKELNRPIVPLHQISRPPKGKKVAEPRLDDLRDSGAVEEDADNVVFIHRDYYYTRKEEDKNLATIIIAKQRNGPVDKVMMKWIPENTMFTELSTEEQW